MSTKLAAAGSLPVLILILTVVPLPPAEAGSVGFEFRKVVDSSSPVPGSTGIPATFSGVSFKDGVVAFRRIEKAQGSWRASQFGIYAASASGISRIADLGMLIPDAPVGAPDDFQTFNFPRTSGGATYFTGGNPATPVQSGIYTNATGSLTKIVDGQTTIPGHSKIFSLTSIGDSSVDDGSTLFYATSSGVSPFHKGIYLHDGTSLSTVVELTDGVGDFQEIYNVPVLSDGDVAFLADSLTGVRGVYKHSGGVASLLVDTSAEVPDYTGPGLPRIFNGLGAFDFDAGNLAFVGGYHYLGSQAGIFTTSGGTLTTVIKTGGPAPGRTNTLRVLDYVSIDDGNVAFTGRFQTSVSTSEAGIYTDLGGSVNKVIDGFDMLGGKDLSNMYTQRQALVGNEIAFTAEFADGTQAIYIARMIEIEDAIESVAEGVDQVVDVAYAAGNFFQELQVTFDEVSSAGDLTVSQMHVSSDAEVAGATGFNFGIPGAMAQVWQILFDGDFSGSALLALGYDDSLFAPGFLETDLQVFHFDMGAWVGLETVSLDTVNNVITVRTDGFSPFALGSNPGSSGGTAVPLPASCWAGLFLLAILGLMRLHRRE